MTDAANAVRKLYTELLDAWNRRDADRFADLFAEDGLSIGFDGSQASGPAEIGNHLRPIFRDHPTAAYVAKVLAVRPIGAQAVWLHSIVGMVPPGRDELNPQTNAIQTMLAELTETGWRIVVFQNTPARYDGRPELVEEHTAQLQPLAEQYLRSRS